MPHDLATLLTRRIEQIFESIRDPDARRQRLEELLRDEILDIERRVAADRITAD